MRFIKAIGLAALGAIVAMALGGASSASAITLCKTSENPCAPKNQVKSLHLVNPKGSVEVALNSVANILCLSVLKEAEVLEPAEHQESRAINLTFNGCGTDASHSNCTVSSPEIDEEHWYEDTFPITRTLFLILKGVRLAKCTLFGFLKVSCEFNEEGISAEVEEAGEGSNGMIRIQEEPLVVSGGGLCPEEVLLDSELEPLEPLYFAE